MNNQYLYVEEYQLKKLREKEIKKIVSRRFKSKGSQSVDTIILNLKLFGLSEEEINKEREKTKFSQRPLM